MKQKKEETKTEISTETKKILTIKDIKGKLVDCIAKINAEIQGLIKLNPKIKINDGKYIQIILSNLRYILGDLETNPIFKNSEAEDYYFGENGFKNIQKKYNDILELQNFIVMESGLPFVYDKFTILKLLQLTMFTYNDFLEDIQTGINARNEDVGNVFLDIELMLINDRNMSAENGTKNAKAVDTVNRYKKESGGFGVRVEKGGIEDNEKKKGYLDIFNEEEAQRKLSAFGFTKLLEEKMKEEKRKK